MTKSRSQEENEAPAAETAASERPAGPETPAVARARAEAHGLFLFGRTPEEEEIREMYGWGV